MTSLNCHRIGRPVTGITRRIQITYSKLGTKNKVFLSRLKLRDNADPIAKQIYINEDLTVRNQEILYISRQLKKKGQDCKCLD